MATSVIGVTDLSFRYTKKSEELFGGLTHNFAPSKVTALTGPSGRGKSTLLYVLGLLLTPSNGRITIHDRDVTRLPDQQRSTIRARQIGFVFQDSELDPTRHVIDSVIEPALYAGQHRTQSVAKAMELLDHFGLSHRADHRPGEVSGGQAQRLAVCRALINDPDIVLADEPTGNLDRDNAEIVLSTLIDVAHQRAHTVIIATHDPFVIEHADEVVQL